MAKKFNAFETPTEVISATQYIMDTATQETAPATDTPVVSKNGRAKTKTRRYQMVFTESMYARISKTAQEQGVSVASLISVACNEYLRKFEEA